MTFNSIKNYKLTISYNGYDFYGWAIQLSKRTVQGVLQSTLSSILNEPIQISGVSRTDSGVHAIIHVSNFKSQTCMPLEILEIALNKRLPRDINVISIENAPLEFHARFDSEGKFYQYRIWIERQKPLFLKGQVYYYPMPKLEIEKMNQEAQKLIGVHDFTSFGSNSRRLENKIREISSVKVYKKDSILYFDIKGKSFLYKMVRGICGTLLEIGRGKNLDIESILKAKDRSQAARNLPGEGLFLINVYY